MINWMLVARDGDTIKVDAPSRKEAPMQAKSRALAEGKPDYDKWLDPTATVVKTYKPDLRTQ